MKRKPTKSVSEDLSELIKAGKKKQVTAILNTDPCRANLVEYVIWNSIGYIDDSAAEDIVQKALIRFDVKLQLQYNVREPLALVLKFARDFAIDYIRKLNLEQKAIGNVLLLKPKTDTDTPLDCAADGEICMLIRSAYRETMAEAPTAERDAAEAMLEYFSDLDASRKRPDYPGFKSALNRFRTRLKGVLAEQGIWEQ